MQLCLHARRLPQPSVFQKCCQVSTAQEYATYLDALGVERRRADVAQ